MQKHLQFKPFEGELTDYQWLVSRVMMHKEFAAAALLQAAGFAVIAPTRQQHIRLSRHARRKTRVDYPLLPGYLIIGVPAGASWIGINHIGFMRGVIGHLYGGDRVPHYLRIEANEHTGEMGLRGLIERYGDGSLPAMLAPATEPGTVASVVHTFQPGDLATLTDPAFSGLTVTIQQITGDAAEILLPLFGGTSSRSVHLSKLRA